MKPKIKALWVKALRSGDYQQTRGRLREGSSFCCLGVLCNLHAMAHPAVAADQISRTEYMGHEGTLPPDVVTWAGLPSDLGAPVTIGCVTRRLSDHNDGIEGARQRSFKEIADAIEKQL